MTTHLTTPFKTQLLDQKASLLAQLATLRGGAVGRAEASAAHFAGQNEDSRAQASTEKELEFALDAHESAELDAIEAALQRIEDGTYGICIDCGSTIPAARLHAAPATLRCIGCQSQVEQPRHPG